MDSLAQLGEEILDTSNAQGGPSDDRKTWALFFLARCLDAFGSVRVMVEHDHVVDAMVGTRVLYEAVISFLYISGGHDDDQQRERLLIWRREGLRQVLRREKHLADVGHGVTGEADDVARWTIRTATNGIQEIEAELGKLGALTSPNPTLIDKTRALDLEGSYAIVYRDASNALHTSPMLLGEYLLADGHGGRRMIDYAPTLLVVCSQMMARLSRTVGGILGIETYSQRAGECTASLARLG